MPLFQIDQSGLVPFRQLRGTAEVFEQEIESLLWQNLNDLVGEVLFPVKRQAQIPGGGRADIVALDITGSVVVIEVKRDIDRAQLAQCLEYAGWARATSLDEIAGLYHRGSDEFWGDWMEFTETEQPRRISKTPRVVLVAREFDDRSKSAFDFLHDSSVPVTLIRLAIYEDVGGRRFLDIEGIDEPELPREIGQESIPVGKTSRGKRITIADLMGAGLIAEGDRLVWDRPRLGHRFEASIEADGRIRLADGSIHGSPSGAAMAAAEVGSYDGWMAWRVANRKNALLADFWDKFKALEVDRRPPQRA